MGLEKKSKRSEVTYEDELEVCIDEYEEFIKMGKASKIGKMSK